MSDDTAGAIAAHYYNDVAAPGFHVTHGLTGIFRRVGDGVSNLFNLSTDVHIFQGAEHQPTGVIGCQYAGTAGGHSADHNTADLVAFTFVADRLSASRESTAVTARHGVGDNSERTHSSFLCYLFSVGL